VKSTGFWVSFSNAGNDDGGGGGGGVPIVYDCWVEGGN